MARHPSGSRSIVFSVGDQALSSATNFGSTIAAATLLSAPGFGDFSIAYVTYLVSLGVVQAFVAQSLVLTTGTPRELRDACLVAVRVGLIIAIPVILVAVVAIAFLVPSAVPALVPIAVVFPLLAGQEVIRHAASLQNRMHLAAAIDAIWLVAVAAPFVALIVVRPSNLQAWVISSIWALGGVLSFLVGSFMIPWHSRERISMRPYLRRSFLGRRFLAEYAVSRGASQSLSIALGFMVGPQPAGAFRGASTVLGPVTVLLGAVSSFGAPVLQRTPERERLRWLVKVTMGLVALALIWTVALLLIPDGLGRAILGDTWAGAKELILPLGLQTVALAVGIPFFMGTRVGWPRMTLWFQLFGSVMMITLFIGGVVVGGVLAAAWGAFVASGLQSVVLVTAYVILTKRMYGNNETPVERAE